MPVMHWPGLRPAAALAAAVLPGAALAHSGLFSGAQAPAALWLAQGFYALAWFGWALGAAQVRPDPRRRLCLHAGMLVVGLALFGPLEAWAEGSTAWHMLQHMLLMVLAAPLLVLARPWPQWRAITGGRLDALARTGARASRRPMACAVLHAGVIWAWHAPPLYMAAVFDVWLHGAEHACFLFTAVLFWWSVLLAGRQGTGAALLALLFTLMHTGLLAALLTFARVPLYASESRELWDQQLAGLLMWVPGGGAYVLAAAWIMARGLALSPGSRRPPASCAAASRRR